MCNQNTKRSSKLRPIEQHTTAAWASIENTKEVSNVAIPSEIQVGDAKDWVDTNQK